MRSITFQIKYYAQYVLFVFAGSCFVTSVFLMAHLWCFSCVYSRPHIWFCQIYSWLVCLKYWCMCLCNIFRTLPSSSDITLTYFWMNSPNIVLVRVLNYTCDCSTWWTAPSSICSLCCSVLFYRKQFWISSGSESATWGHGSFQTL